MPPADQIYAGDAIDRMNRARSRKPASGGTNYAKRDRLMSKSSAREHIASLDVWDRAMNELERIELDFFAFLTDSRNAVNVLQLDTDANGEVPF